MAAERLGYRPRLIECAGEARGVGREHGALARSLAPGEALISGGELVVTVAGHGRGGPNQEYALAAALALDGVKRVSGLAGDTDGIDGNGDAAGAFFDGATARPRRNAEAALAANDAGTFLDRRGALFRTGADRHQRQRLADHPRRTQERTMSCGFLSLCRHAGLDPASTFSFHDVREEGGPRIKSGVTLILGMSND